LPFKLPALTIALQKQDLNNMERSRLSGKSKRKILSSLRREMWCKKVKCALASSFRCSPIRNWLQKF